MNLSDKVPPHDVNAERGVLGSLLRDNLIIPETLDAVAAEAFHLDAHQRIFRAVADLYAERKPADLVTVASLLNDRGHLADVGGHGYLVLLWESSPTAANARYHTEIVRDKATLRGLIHTCTDLLRDAYDQSRPAEELVNDAQRQMLALGSDTRKVETRKLAEVLHEVKDEIDRRAQHPGEVTGVPFGLVDLDAVTGGLHPGELCILAARPSVGKTALAGNVCRNAAAHGYGSLMFSLEQSRLELASRWLCGEASVNSYAVRRGRLAPDQVTRLVQAASGLAPLPIWINDTPAQRVRTILAAGRRLKAAEGVGLIVVDYLQLVEPEDRRALRNEQVAQISRALKLTARELNVPILCLSQMSRESEKQERRPRLSDLRDSGAIEQDADTVIFLHRPAARDEQAKVELIEAIVEKQRNGPCGAVPLMFRKETMRFENRGVEVPA